MRRMKHRLVVLEWYLWRHRFFRMLREEVRFLFPSDVDARLRASRRNTRLLFQEHRHEAPDPQGVLAVGIPSMLLGSYRELTARGASHDTAYEAVRRAWRKTFEYESRLVARVLMLFMRNPVETWGKHYTPFLRFVFGRSFTFNQEATDSGWKLVVPCCGFYRFFIAEGAPQVAPIVCEWDRNYLNVLDRSRRPIATQRPMTMATGQSRCEFHFSHAPATPSKTRDVVIEHGR